MLKCKKWKIEILTERGNTHKHTHSLTSTQQTINVGNTINKWIKIEKEKKQHMVFGCVYRIYLTEIAEITEVVLQRFQK